MQSTYTTEGESSEAIKADIERTRNEMSNKIDTIQDRLNPETLKVQAKDAINTAMRDGADSLMEYMRGHSSEIGISLVDTVKRNPVPAALIGVGIGWLLLDGLSRGNGGNHRSANTWQSRQSKGDTGNGYQTESDRYRSQASYAGGEYSSYSTPNHWQEDDVYANDHNKGIGQQVRDKVGQVADSVRNKVGEIADQVSDKASELTGQIRSEAQSWSEGAQDQSSHLSNKAQDYTQKTGTQMQTVIEDNVIAVSAAALVAGAMLGLVLPATRRENEMMGEWRDQALEKAQSVASDVAQKAQEVVQEVKSDAQQIAANVVDELAQSGKAALTGAQSSGNAGSGQDKNTNAHNLEATSSVSSWKNADKVSA